MASFLITPRYVLHAIVELGARNDRYAGAGTVTVDPKPSFDFPDSGHSSVELWMFVADPKLKLEPATIKLRSGLTHHLP